METILEYFSDFTPLQIRQFEGLSPVYREWNEKINVISRKDIDGLYEKHVLHSLSIAAAFEFQPGMEILDLGTGGGFPGIPLAIFFPEVKFHLVDSIAKKLKVVDAVAAAIGLENVSTWHGRAEEIKNRKFDFVVSRAVAPLGDLWKWSRPILKPGTGVKNKESTSSEMTIQPGLICLKGGNLAQEIQDSGVRPRILEIKGIFNRPYFEDKFLLYVPR
jgi:16S rRNA (guanine527-N7)-methyltransferase